MINLLPHREAARKTTAGLFSICRLGASALAGALIAGVVFLWFQAQISAQQDKNQLLQTEIRKLEGQIKEIAGLEAEIAALRARQQAVEDLQSDRNLPVHLLTELVKQLPDGVYITNMRQENQNWSPCKVWRSPTSGVSNCCAIWRTTRRGFPSRNWWKSWLVSPIWLPRDQRRVSNFPIRVRLVRASEAQKSRACEQRVCTRRLLRASVPCR